MPLYNPTTIAGADTRVLFFDGANTPAGDAGFTYNKTADDLFVAGGLYAGAYPAGTFAVLENNVLTVGNDTIENTVALERAAASATPKLQVFGVDTDVSLNVLMQGAGTINLTASSVLSNGKRLQGTTTDAQTWGLAVYDVNGTAYRDFLVATNGNAPAVVMSIPTTGSLAITATSVKATVQTTENATTGLGAGLLSALTNASLVITDGTGQVYRVPCII